MSVNPLAYLIEWFHEVHLPGGYGMGPFPLEYTEMMAYSKSRQRDLRYWEYDLLRSLSEAYCIVWGEKQKREQSMPAGMKPVAMSDSQGIKALFSKQGDRKKGKK